MDLGHRRGTHVDPIFLSSVLFAVLIFLGSTSFFAVAVLVFEECGPFRSPVDYFLFKMYKTAQWVVLAGLGHAAAACAITRLRQPLSSRGAVVSATVSFLAVAVVAAVVRFGGIGVILPEPSLLLILLTILFGAVSSIPGLLFATRGKGENHSH